MAGVGGYQRIHDRRIRIEAIEQLGDKREQRRAVGVGKLAESEISSHTASSRSERVGKCRYTVRAAIPAALATLSLDISVAGCSVSTSMAAAMIRSRVIAACCRLSGLEYDRFRF